MMNKILLTGSNGYVGSSFLNQYSFEKFSLLNQKLNFDSIDIILHCASKSRTFL